MYAPRRPPAAALFIAALAVAALLSVSLLVTFGGPQPAHSQGALLNAISPLAAATVSPLPTPTPVETDWAVATAPGSFYRLRLPPGWYVSFYDQGYANIDNYDTHAFDHRPENGINIHVSMGERPFSQTFEQYVAEWKKNESTLDLGPYPTPIPITPFQPIMVGGYAGVSEIIQVEMENGEQWPIQSILLDVERRWIVGITIKPALSPDYDQALRIVGTLEIAPRCVAEVDPYTGVKDDLRAELETVVAHELEARQTANWPAFLSLVHSETDPQWLEQEHHLLGRGWQAINLTRIERSDDWALAAAIETHAVDKGRPVLFYTTRTFRQVATGCWELTSPSMYAWIERDENGVTAEEWLKFGPLSVTFLVFDSPYVRAVGPRAALLLPQMAADFGVIYTGNRTYSVRLNSFPASDDWFASGSSRESVIPSPLAPGFFIGSVQSPEEYLLAYLIDYLGHRLLTDEFGERAQEPARLALAHAAVQWEAEQAVGRDSSANLRAQVTGARTPLAVLLDPTTVDVTATSTAEQGLFLRFAVAQYGREIIAPYLRAVFTASSAQELIRQAFQQEPEAIEQQWQAWLN